MISPSIKELVEIYSSAYKMILQMKELVSTSTTVYQQIYEKQVSQIRHDIVPVKENSSVLNSKSLPEHSNNLEIPQEKKHPIMMLESETRVNWGEIEQSVLADLRWEELKSGESNKLEDIIQNLINLTSQKETLTWLNEMYLKHNENALFVCTLFHTISHMDYADVLPNGPTMAMASLNHKDERVVGYAVKSFFNWNSKNALRYLRSNEPKIDWVKKEWNNTIKYIEKFGDEDDELSNKDG